jgi:hypothetical protein
MSSVPIRTLVLALIAALGGMQALLWGFLGLGAGWIAGGLCAIAVLLWGLSRAPGWHGAVSLPALLTGFVTAALVLMLGGEGGWFFAPPDWQVRYAVLRDLTLNPWPFALAHPGGPLILRAPLGMYLAPALFAHAHFAHSHFALLVQNTLLLGVVLALGAALFPSARARWIGLGVFWAFSGMDILGQAFAGGRLTLHLESWAGLQYSSAITQIFWAPQHALAGWIIAVLYLLWREGKVPAAVLLSAVPLIALLSPLAMLGALPFAAHAALNHRNPLWPALATLITAPALLYLTMGSAAVGGGVAQSHHLNAYLLFILLEIGGYLMALRAVGRDQPFGLATTLITCGALLLIPFGQIGQGPDFVMRGSIPALAVMAVMMARILAAPAPPIARRWVLLVGLIGLATPVGEIWRALTWGPSPQVTCGYLGVVPNGYATYTTPLRHLPARPTIIAPEPPHPCWSRPWPDPISGRPTLTHPY